MKTQTTVHYCAPCKTTTRHAEVAHTSVCQRCGVEKKRVRAIVINRAA